MSSKEINITSLKEVLDVIETVLIGLEVDFYLIGAIAREHWYSQGDKITRSTKDVDFAVLVPNHEVYEQLRERLKEHKFFETRANAFVMISPDGIQVDLLPFGDIAENDGVSVTGTGMTTIKVAGLMEVYQAGTANIILATGHAFKAATLPGIVLLKLIAYDDRPEERQKDARDITGIIQHFFDLHADLIYAHHIDLFAEGQTERELEDFSAIVIGRAMQVMSGSNATLYERLEGILTKHIEAGASSAFIQQMVSATRKDVDLMVRWLSGVREGLINPLP